MAQRRRPMTMVGSTVVGMIALTGCGMLPSSDEPDTGTSAAMSVEVQVSSDANTATPGASWIACNITLDGEVVSEQRAEGEGAIAICEKKLTVGPQ